MRAEIGDRLQIHGKTIGRANRSGTITAVRGPEGSPPYLVQFDDGHETLVYPGSDCVVTPHEEPGAPAQRSERKRGSTAKRNSR